MAVDDGGVLRAGKPGNPVSEAGMEAGRAAKRRDLDALPAQLGAPRPFNIQAADGHRELWLQASDDLDDQALGSTGMKAEDDLKDARLVDHALTVMLPPSRDRVFSRSDGRLAAGLRSSSAVTRL